MYDSRNETYPDERYYSRRKYRPRVPDLQNIIGATVCSVYQVDPKLMQGTSRGTARVALARQVAMYLAHVIGRLDYTEVGRLFGRDRTTVTHACATIEDRRDDADFDRTMDLLEGIVHRLCGVTRIIRAEATH